MALETSWNWVFSRRVVADVAMDGFAHAAASIASCTDPANWQCVSWFGKNNVTDVPVGTRDKMAQIYTLPGTS